MEATTTSTRTVKLQTETTIERTNSREKQKQKESEQETHNSGSPESETQPQIQVETWSRPPVRVVERINNTLQTEAKLRGNVACSNTCIIYSPAVLNLSTSFLIFLQLLRHRRPRQKLWRTTPTQVSPQERSPSLSRNLPTEPRELCHCRHHCKSW